MWRGVGPPFHPELVPKAKTIFDFDNWITIHSFGALVLRLSRARWLGVFGAEGCCCNGWGIRPAAGGSFVCAGATGMARQQQHSAHPVAEAPTPLHPRPSPAPPPIPTGWPSVEAYYHGSSSALRIPKVTIPLLCIQALDDPIAPKEAIPYDACQANPNCVLVTTACGGHLGWVSGPGAPFSHPWTDNVMTEWFSSVHLQLLQRAAKGAASNAEVTAAATAADGSDEQQAEVAAAAAAAASAALAAALQQQPQQQQQQVDAEFVATLQAAVHAAVTAAVGVVVERRGAVAAALSTGAAAEQAAAEAAGASPVPPASSASAHEEQVQPAAAAPPAPSAFTAAAAGSSSDGTASREVEGRRRHMSSSGAEPADSTGEAWALGARAASLNLGALRWNWS